MSLVSLNRIALFVVAALLLGSGCQPVGSGATDEEKEPQFLIGRSRVNAMNFSGAIDAFERALELNPQSAAAHFELGWLYAEKQPDEAAAIYHYQKYLALRPQASNAETIRQHILRLKQELAKAALPIPPSSEIQRQLEKLMAENRRLQDEVDQYQEALARTPAAGTVHADPAPPAGAQRASRETPPSAQRPPTSGADAVRANPAAPVSHRVQAGETPTGIARHYHVSLEALLSANPGVNPRRMPVGQILRIPRG